MEFICVDSWQLDDDGSNQPLDSREVSDDRENDFEEQAPSRSTHSPVEVELAGFKEEECHNDYSNSSSSVECYSNTSVKEVIVVDSCSETEEAGEVGSFPCSVCSLLFSTVSLLTQHEVIHGERFGRYPVKRLGSYPCIICNKICSTHSQLSEHQKEHISTTCSCITCGTEFARSSELNQHQHAHGKGVGSICVTCGVEFINGLSFETHRQLHGSKKEKVVKMLSCAFCDETFKTAREKMKHKKKQGCKKKRRKEAYEELKRNGKVASCRKYCNRKFPSIWQRNDHELEECSQEAYKTFKLGIHTDEYACKECGLTFKNLYEFTEHKNSPYVCVNCHICGQRCIDLKKHLMRHKELCCKKCSLHFEKIADLEGHMLKCESPVWKCQSCGELCQDEAALQFHQLSHRDDSLYEEVFV